MKTSVIIIALAISVRQVNGQIEHGRIFLTTLFTDFSLSKSKSVSTSGVNGTRTNWTRGFYVNPEITIGKLNENILVSYGINCSYGLSKQDQGSRSRIISVGPAAAFQKFYKVTDRIFLSPFLRMHLGYKHGRSGEPGGSTLVQKGFIGSLEFYPFSAIVKIDGHTNFILFISRVGFDFDRTTSFFKERIDNSKTVSSNLMLSGYLNTIGFGFQKAL